jgi:hypothetical protein
MPIGASISPIGKVMAIMAVGAALSSCAGSSRVDGVLPSWANPQPQTAEPAQNQTKITKREAEARKKRESQTSQLSVNLRAPNKPRPKAPKTLLKNNDGAVSASFSVDRVGSGG